MYCVNLFVHLLARGDFTPEGEEDSAVGSAAASSLKATACRFVGLLTNPTPIPVDKNHSICLKEICIGCLIILFATAPLRCLKFKAT